MKQVTLVLEQDLGGAEVRLVDELIDAPFASHLGLPISEFEDLVLVTEPGPVPHIIGREVVDLAVQLWPAEGVELSLGEDIVLKPDTLVQRLPHGGDAINVAMVHVKDGVKRGRRNVLHVSNALDTVAANEPLVFVSSTETLAWKRTWTLSSHAGCCGHTPARPTSPSLCRWAPGSLA